MTRFDYNRPHPDIILACQLPDYKLYYLGDCGDVYRNLDLLELFEGVEVLCINLVTPRFHEMKRRYKYSESFEARRAGEVLRWATDRRIIERVVEAGQPAWRILEREMQYLAVGPANKQRAIRIRGLTDRDAAREAEKLEKREMGRRQRAHDKIVAKRQADIRHSLDIIMEFQPDAPLHDDLSQFAVEGFDYIRSYRDVLIEAAAGPDGRAIWASLDHMKVRAEFARYDAEQAARKAAAEAPVVPDDDADAMADIEF